MRGHAVHLAQPHLVELDGPDVDLPAKLALSIPITAFVVASFVVLIAMVRGVDRDAAWFRGLVRLFAAGTVVFWAVRLPMILLNDHPAGFLVVHAVLAVASVAAAVAAWRSLDRPDSAVGPGPTWPPPAAERQTEPGRAASMSTAVGRGQHRDRRHAEDSMATFVLIPGAGSDSWYWHLVVPELRAAGHDVVAVDLPCDDDSAGLDEYTDAVVDAVGSRATTDDLVVVAQSMGGFTAPLVCERVPVRLMVLVAAMVPTPGETGGDWWTNTGQGEAMRAAARDGGYSVEDFDESVLFLHDVPAALIEESAAHHAGPVGHAVRRSPGRSTAGPTCPLASSCAATTGCSPPTSSGASSASASASIPTRCRAATCPRSPGRTTWRSSSSPTGTGWAEPHLAPVKAAAPDRGGRRGRG